MAGPLAQKVRAKYPGAYDDMSDEQLEAAVLAKYPEYKDLAQPTPEPQAEPAPAPKPRAGIVDNVAGFGESYFDTFKDAIGGAISNVYGMNADPVRFFSDAGMGAYNAIQQFREASGKDQAKTGATLAVETATGIPINQTVEDYQAGNYGSAAGRVAAALTMLGIGGRAQSRVPKPAVPKVLPKPGAPRPTSPLGGVKGAGRSLEDELVGVINELRGPEGPPASSSLPTRPQPVPTASAAETRARAAIQGRATPDPTLSTPEPVQDVQNVREPSTMGKAAADVANRRVSKIGPPKGMTERRQADLLNKYGGNGKADGDIAAKSIANGQHIEEAFAEMMAAKGARIEKAAEPALAQGNVILAAETIERSIPQTVAELARDLRRAVGSSKAGAMINPENPKLGQAQVKRLAPGPSRRPLEAEVADLDRGYARMLDDERGGVNPKLVGSLGLGAAGAAYGAATGEDEDDSALRALGYGAGGALIVPFIAHAAAVGVPKALQNALYTSVLSSPTSVIKAYSGAVGGSIAAAVERIFAGNVRDGSKILTTLFNPKSVATFVKALKNPQTADLSGMAGGQTPTIVGRVFGAGDAVGRAAMTAGGVSADDAGRYMLSGNPTSPLGKEVLGLWSRWFTLRLATSLFPRVGIQVLERGLERTPLGLSKKLGLQTGGGKKVQAVRAAAGPAAGLAAYAANDDVPTWAKPFLVALSGVYALPVAAGMAVATKQEKDPDAGIVEQLEAGPLGEIAKNMPFPQYGPGEALSIGGRAASLVPNLLRDVARARDPHERKTAGDPLGRAKAKIPGLRETLPVKGRNVNIVGEPNEDRSTTLSRFMSPESRSADPRKDIPERVTNELDRLGVKINVPQFEKEIPVGRRKIAVPPDAAERARKERRQYLLPQIEKLLDSPAYQRADDEGKKRRLEAVILRAEQAGGQRARANIIKTLRSQGAFRAR